MQIPNHLSWSKREYSHHLSWSRREHLLSSQGFSRRVQQDLSGGGFSRRLAWRKILYGSVLRSTCSNLIEGLGFWVSGLWFLVSGFCFLFYVFCSMVYAVCAFVCGLWFMIHDSLFII